MNRIFSVLLPVLLIGAAGQAATTNTTLTVNATATINFSTGNVDVSGTANLTNIGNGTFKESLAVTSLIGTTSNVSLPLPVTLTGGTLNITLSVPASALTSGGGSVSGSGTVTGGTGTYAGATGSFPSLTGTATGSITSNWTLTFSGPGTVTTSGSGGGGGPTTPTPTITAVQDAGSYTANIAEGSIFVVKGSDLSSSGFNSFTFPLPTTSTASDKVKITFTPTAGGAGTDAYLIYTYNQSGVNQLAAILPSNVAAGNYNVTVTANGTAGTPFPVTVVQRKLGLFSQDTSGSGLVVAQNVVSATQYDINRFTTGTVNGLTISPAKPGQTLVAYGTGLGPVSGGDNVASPGFDFTQNGVNVQAVVGGKSIPVLYAGRTPTLAGLDQINFTLPSDVPTGCTVSFQISVNGQLTPATFIAIAPDANSSACVAPGYTTSQLQDFDNGKTITSGAFSLTQLATSFNGSTYKIDSVGGGFTQITGFQLASAGQYNISSSTTGSCQVLHVTGSGGNLGGGTATGLDAGTVTFSGPGISSPLTVTQSSSKSYFLSLGTEGISIPGQASITLGPGTYNLNGAGGKDVGSFKASVTIGTPLTISGGLPATVNRSSNLTLNWTGGNSSDLVEIIGYSGTTSGTGANATTDATEFICTTTAGPGTFTVPSSVLSQLPPATNTGNSTGFLEVTSGPTPTTFSAPLTAGGSINNAIFAALVGIGGQATYQ